MLAAVDSTLPAGLQAWNVDFFLPAATTLVEPGFSALTFTGVEGTAAADFAALFSNELETIWRFNAATQQWDRYGPALPAFVNTLTTLHTRDALLLQAVARERFQQIDYVPRSGGVPRTISLLAGANLVSYTGSGGDIRELLAGVAGLSPAFVRDGATQRWLAYIPDAPAFASEVSTLSRLDGLWLQLDAATSWSFNE